MQYVATFVLTEDQRHVEHYDTGDPEVKQLMEDLSEQADRFFVGKHGGVLIPVGRMLEGMFNLQYSERRRNDHADQTDLS
jgi:hypothetical protein